MKLGGSGEGPAWRLASFSFSSRYSSRLLLSALFMANGSMKYELRLLQKSPSPCLAISPGALRATKINCI